MNVFVESVSPRSEAMTQQKPEDEAEKHAAKRSESVNFQPSLIG